MSRIFEIYGNSIIPQHFEGISDKSPENNISNPKKPLKFNVTDKYISTKENINPNYNYSKKINDFVKNQSNDIHEKTKIIEDKSSSNPGTKELTKQEKQYIKKLKSIDRKVKAHESAHRSAGGGLVRGGTTFEYDIGPDGKRYAVAGEVKIDMTYDLDNPEQVIQKMRQVKQAALAPADPSPQDRAVAVKAARIEAKATSELRKQRNSSNLNKPNFLPKIYRNTTNTIDKNIGNNINFSISDNLINLNTS